MSLQTLMRVNSEYQLRVGDIADRRKGKSTCRRTQIFLEKVLRGAGYLFAGAAD